MADVHRIAAVLLLLGGALAWPATGCAAAVDGLYEGAVAGDMTETGREAAAAEALRLVAVRVTGRRSAATDPALAPLYADAPRLVQTFRSGAAGQVVVAFDPETLDAQLGKAGQRVWGRERPATLVVLVSTAAGAPARLLAPAAAALRKELATAAQLRGLPLVWPAGLPTGAEELRYQDALAGRLEPLVDLARQYGAEGVLLGRVGAAGAAGPLWSYSGSAGEVAPAGTGADAVQDLADRYGGLLAAPPAGAGRLLAVVRGIRDLSSYAAAFAALGAVPNVRAVTLEEAGPTTLRFRVAFDGDAEGLRRALQESPRLQLDDAPAAAGELALVLRP
jgi:hypothetical protein